MKSTGSVQKRGRVASFLKFFYYISLICVLLTLAHTELLQPLNFVSPWLLIPSLLLLLFGFLVETFPWHQLLRHQEVPITLVAAFRSIGITVFGKYIPGKIWAVIGRSVFVSVHCKTPQAPIIAAALNCQIIAILSGLFLGLLAATCWLSGSVSTVLAILISLICLGTILMTDFVNRIVYFCTIRLHRGTTKSPILPPASVLKLLLWYLIQWCVWGLAFAILVQAITGADLSMAVGLSFPLAVTLGILTIVAPGGLGVREGLLGIYLVQLGLSPVDAIMVAVTSRLWFLVGEALTFLLASILPESS